MHAFINMVEVLKADVLVLPLCDAPSIWVIVKVKVDLVVFVISDLRAH